MAFDNLTVNNFVCTALALAIGQREAHNNKQTHLHTQTHSVTQLHLQQTEINNTLENCTPARPKKATPTSKRVRLLNYINSL